MRYWKIVNTVDLETNKYIRCTQVESHTQLLAAIEQFFGRRKHFGYIIRSQYETRNAGNTNNDLRQQAERQPPPQRSIDLQKNQILFYFV